MSFIISSIKKLFALFGLEVRRIPERDYATSKFFPYFKKIQIQDISFDMFLGDTDAAHWYDAWYPNMLTSELIAIQNNLKVTTPKLIVDIGAHHGFSTVFFAKAFPDAKIIAIEPNTINYTLLKSNVAHNQLDNVDCIKSLLSSADNEMKRINTDSSNSYVSFHKDDQSENMATKTLDSLITDRVDFIKIDVEGFELEVLKGATGILKLHAPTIELELHPIGLKSYNSSIELLANFFKEHLYLNYYLILEDGAIKHLNAFPVDDVRKNLIITK